MMATLEVRSLCYKIKDKKILDNINFSSSSNGMIGILGPNGSGKTTLLKCIDRLIMNYSGSIVIDGNDIKDYKRTALSRIISYVPQISDIPYGFSVEEIVQMGRTPYMKDKHNKDGDIVLNAMESLSLTKKRNDDIATLSGGEYQRVLIARAIAQQTNIILLDEPTAHLDIKYQYEILDHMNRLKDKTVIATFHDISLAKRFCKRIIMLKDSMIAADGDTSDIINRYNIQKVFEIDY